MKTLETLDKLLANGGSVRIRYRDQDAPTCYRVAARITFTAGGMEYGLEAMSNDAEAALTNVLAMIREREAEL